MKTWKLKFNEDLFLDLKAYLFSSTPLENGCFLLCQPKGKLLFVQEIFRPTSADLIRREEDLCVPAPKYIAQAAAVADKKDLSLVFIHTHPDKDHPSTFSTIDDLSNDKLFENLGSFLSQPVGSLVMSAAGLHGVMYSDKQIEPIGDYSIYGKRFTKITDAAFSEEDLNKEEFDRQLRIMKNTSVPLAELNVAIIGLGGIGSPLSVLLAKMGVQNFGYYDQDLVEVHNLPRILGANTTSIGKPKVEVVKDFVHTFSNAQIHTYQDMVGIFTDLTDYDIILGCVDNHTTRDCLNTHAIQNAIPYIDAACSIPLNATGNVEQAVIAISSVLPSSACLWCNKTINAMRIMEESLSPEERESRFEEGYVKEIDKAPSVISLTSGVASFAINRMLNLIGILPGSFCDKVIYDFNDTLLIDKDFSKGSNCRCSKDSPFKISQPNQTIKLASQVTLGEKGSS